MDFGAIGTILQEVAPYAGMVLGSLTHMVKKKTEASGTDDEVAILKNMIAKKPLNTAVALATSLGLVALVVIPEASLIQQVLAAFIAGYTSDSAINRPGK